MLHEIAGFPGWWWRALGEQDLPLAWPLARIAGTAVDLESWLALAGRWIARERAGLGALVNPGGVVVGLERHRLRTMRGAPALSVGWLRTLEVTPAPRCLEALLEAMGTLARRTGCEVLELTDDEVVRDRLATLAQRLGLAARPGAWLRSLAAVAAAPTVPPPSRLC